MGDLIKCFFCGIVKCVGKFCSEGVNVYKYCKLTIYSG